MAWLSRFVEEVRVIAPAPGRPLHLKRLPDGRTSLVVRVLDGGHAGDVSIMGPRTRALFKTATELAYGVIVQFKPGWSAPLLGVAASTLTDRIVSLRDLWGPSGGDLSSELLATRGTPDDLIDRLSRAIAARSEHAIESATARLARRAVRLLENGDEARIDRVATRLGVTARHLRRAFLEHVGIGPKDFARTVRLRRAVQMSATSMEWSRIAGDAGYYDQAHLIAEFHELVGLTPVAFRNQPG